MGKVMWPSSFIVLATITLSVQRIGDCCCGYVKSERPVPWRRIITAGVTGLSVYYTFQVPPKPHLHIHPGKVASHSVSFHTWGLPPDLSKWSWFRVETCAKTALWYFITWFTPSRATFNPVANLAIQGDQDNTSSVGLPLQLQVTFGLAGGEQGCKGKWHGLSLCLNYLLLGSCK